MAKIVIDARPINSSTGHYMLRLLQYLEKLDQENKYVITNVAIMTESPNRLKNGLVKSSVTAKPCICAR